MSIFIKFFYPIQTNYYLGTSFQAVLAIQSGEQFLFRHEAVPLVQTQEAMSMERAYLNFANGEAYILDQTGFVHSLIVGSQLPPTIKPFHFKLIPSYFYNDKTQQWLTLVYVGMAVTYQGRYVMPLMLALLIQHYFEGTAESFQTKLLAAWKAHPDVYVKDRGSFHSMIQTIRGDHTAYGFWPPVLDAYPTLVDFTLMATV